MAARWRGKEATGYGNTYFTRAMLEAIGEDFAGNHHRLGFRAMSRSIQLKRCRNSAAR